jgi:outer membrane protein assembly factor BamA
MPTAGWELSLGAGILKQQGDNNYGYWEASVDIKRYVHLFNDRYMVFRTATRNVEPFSEREIPFYHLSQIGQWKTIRGFSRSRFRDKDLLLGSVEYRWPLAPRFLHALIFVDAGKVSDDVLDNINKKNYEITYGIGILGWYQNGVLIRAELGRSADQIRFNLNFN